jgi:hypothetical protein
MTDIRAKFAVFFGRADERPEGRYWTVDEDLKGTFAYGGDATVAVAT